MKKIFTILSIMSFLVGACTFAYATDDNLLTNAGFDTGAKSPWVTYESNADKSSASVSSGQYLSPGYSAALSMWNGGTTHYVTLSQGFSIESNTTYYFGAYIKSLQASQPLTDGASAWVYIKWFDHSGGTAVGTIAETAKLSSSNDAWEYLGSSAISPDDATYAKLFLKVESPGTYATAPTKTAYFDNAIVTTTPEPISSALFLVGGAMFAVRQYRKRGKKV